MSRVRNTNWARITLSFFSFAEAQRFNRYFNELSIGFFDRGHRNDCLLSLSVGEVVKHWAQYACSVALIAVTLSRCHTAMICL